MKRSRGIIRAISAFALATILVLSASTPAMAVAEDYNYSRPGSVGNETICSSDILTDLLGMNISEAEKNYLNVYSDFSFSYAASIPTSYVTTEYNEDSGELSVNAYEYSYIAENGVMVTWVPHSISYKDNEEAPTLEGGVYKSDFSGVEIGDDNSVKVSYKSEFEISAESINSFLNLAYNDAPRLKDEIEKGRADYEAAKIKYEEDKSLYSEYVEKCSEYEGLLAIYRDYLSAKKIFDEKLEAYNNYLSELADYESAKLKHAEYLVKLQQYNSDYSKYQTYISNKDLYDREAKAYEEYLQKMEKVKNHLALMDSLKTPATSLKRTVYSAIMGDTVTQVVENKDLVAGKLTGADPKAVDLAGSVTEKLRALMTDYFEITTDSGKYSYYVAHYEEFRDNFADLLRALDDLYSVKPVWSAVKASGKQDKFQILLAQLYYVVNALSDSPVLNYKSTAYFDENYYADPLLKLKPNEIIGSVFIVDTNDATPVSGGYPQKVEKPDVSPVDEPVKPDFVKEPTAPDFVENPGKAPETLSEPQAPEYMHEPTEPAPYFSPLYAEEIIELCDTGAVQKREEYTESQVLSLTVNVNKRFHGATEVSVVYHGTDGNVIYRTNVDSGTFADFGASLPQKAEDASATYKFSAWIDSNGNKPDLSNVTEDLLLYPEFEPTYKKYDITWNVDGNRLTESVTWGEIPVYDGTPKKDGTSNTCFVFTGWDKQVLPVSGEKTYTAVFDEKYFIPFTGSLGGADITFDGSTYTADCHSGLSNTFNISKLVELASGNYSVKIKTVNGDISFSYSDTLKLSEQGVSSFRISCVQKGRSGYIYTLYLYDSAGNAISEDISASMTLPCAISDFSHLKLYRLEGEERKSVRYSEDGSGNISFSSLIGVSHYAMLEYPVTVITSDLIDVNVDKSVASPGEEIKLSFEVPNGLNFSGAYYINDNGEKVRIDGKSISMPSYELRIGVDATPILYTVKFVSAGKVIAEYICKYGDMPEVPLDPKKVADSSYEYTFTGWSSPVSPVTEDTVYTAKFSKTPIEKKVDTGLQISPSIMKLLLLAGAAVALLLVGIIPASVMIPVMAVKRKKLINPSKNVAREHT